MGWNFNVSFRLVVPLLKFRINIYIPTGLGSELASAVHKRQESLHNDGYRVVRARATSV